MAWEDSPEVAIPEVIENLFIMLSALEAKVYSVETLAMPLIGAEGKQFLPQLVLRHYLPYSFQK
jgi:hypothetical protein